MEFLDEIIDSIGDFLDENPAYKTIDYHHFANPLEEMLFDNYLGNFESIKTLDLDKPLEDIYTIYSIAYINLGQINEAEKYLKEVLSSDDLENVKFNLIGDISVLSPKLQNYIMEAREKSKNNTGLQLNIAFNYGGRAEIVRAVKQIATDVEKGKINVEDINEEIISNNLYTKGQPDPDLLIRTSGEIRTSNFLPWQIVYSEFYFPEKNWPEFNDDDFLEAIRVYQSRNRRFGKF